MKEFILEHLDAFITALVGGFSGWFFTRKQQNANTKVTEGDALAGMQRAYDKLVEDMNNKFEELKRDNEQLKKEIDKLHKENRELKKLLENDFKA